MRAARVTATVLALAGALLVPINASANPLARPAIEAADASATLDAKGRAPKAGYDRAEFGSPWTDVDGNGCDTRNDILRRDLVKKRILPHSLSDAWQKGEGDAATWLPPNKAYRCSFVARQVAVKARYGLWVTNAEKAAIARVLVTCPAHPLPR